MSPNDQSRTGRWMSLASLGAQAPAVYELVRQIGLRRRRSRAVRAAERAGWFGAGAALGGGLALLLAPRNGRELRRRLASHKRRARGSVPRDPVHPGNSGVHHANADQLRG